MAHLRKPDWLKIEKGASRCGRVGRVLDAYGLNTVCEQAGCPNQGECFKRGTATFLLLGGHCTRNCTFCNVTHAPPQAVDPGEPSRVAEAVAALGLRHAVITSVTRDDLPDGGAAHFAKTVRAIRENTPTVTVEVLIPDFQGNDAALKIVADAAPDVLNHNVETVPALYADVRPQAIFERSIALLRRARALDPALTTKSGFMLGLGETEAQVLSLLDELRRVGCSIVTIGQYLQPSPLHHPVRAYIHPDRFAFYQSAALDMGIPHVVSGPLIRSSYHADFICS